jgi:hypothetical protein
MHFLLLVKHQNIPWCHFKNFKIYQTCDFWYAKYTASGNPDAFVCNALHSEPGLPDGLFSDRTMLVYFMDIWSILRPFDIFYSHLVYLVVIWYTFPRFVTLHLAESGKPVRNTCVRRRNNWKKLWLLLAELLLKGSLKFIDDLATYLSFSVKALKRELNVFSQQIRQSVCQTIGFLWIKFVSSFISMWPHFTRKHLFTKTSILYASL